MLLDWPLRRGGRPVTTAANLEIWNAFCLHDPVLVRRIDACRDNNNWRRDYPTVVEAAGRLAVVAPPDRLLQMCQAGLQKAHEIFVVRGRESDDDDAAAAAESDDDGSTTIKTPQQVMAEAADRYYRNKGLPTMTCVGCQPDDNGRAHPFRLASPVHDGDESSSSTTPRWLHGTAAVAQLQAWERYGCLEPSAVQRAAAVFTAPDGRPLVADKIFCLLGITSELGPARELLRMPGAHVLGVARSGHKLEELVAFCRSHAPVSTTLQVPEHGADLLRDFAAIAEWILEVSSSTTTTTTSPADPAAAVDQKQLVLCMTAYMDGEANVRVTVAMDLIVQYILQRRKNVALSYLTSPATVYTIPRAAAEQARDLYTPTLAALSYLTLGRWFRPVRTWQQQQQPPTGDDDGPDIIVLNAIIELQGPNYCLAKMLQQWRGLVAHAEGIVVSAPHAPPTRTYSVTHNGVAGTALQGQGYICPLVTFDVAVCSTLMTAILLAHLQDPPTPPPTPPPPDRPLSSHHHPMELFWDGAVHGGIWRCPVTIGSIGPVSYLLGRVLPMRYPAASLAKAAAGEIDDDDDGDNPTTGLPV